MKIITANIVAYGDYINSIDTKEDTARTAFSFIKKTRSEDYPNGPILPMVGDVTITNLTYRTVQSTSVRLSPNMHNVLTYL